MMERMEKVQMRQKSITKALSEEVTKETQTGTMEDAQSGGAHSSSSASNQREYVVNGFSHRPGIADHFPVTFFSVRAGCFQA